MLQGNSMTGKLLVKKRIYWLLCILWDVQYLSDFALLYCFWSEGDLRYARSINVTSTILWIGRIDSTLHRAADCSGKENKEWPKKPSQSSSICHLNERALLSDQNQRFCQGRSITGGPCARNSHKTKHRHFFKASKQKKRRMSGINWKAWENWGGWGEINLVNQKFLLLPTVGPVLPYLFLPGSRAADWKPGRQAGNRRYSGTIQPASEHSNTFVSYNQI